MTEQSKDGLKQTEKQNKNSVILGIRRGQTGCRVHWRPVDMGTAVPAERRSSEQIPQQSVAKADHQQLRR